MLRALLFCAVILCVYSSTAWAESAAAPCDTRERVLPRVTQLPANAPAIVVLPPQVVFARDAGDFVFRLKSPSGQWEPTSVTQDGTSAFLLSPAAALSEGHYSVHYENVCAYWSGAMPEKEEKVNVGPPVALPSEVAVSAEGVFEFRELCHPLDGSIRVTVELTPEMRAYREVSHFSASFQGRSTTVPYGDHNVVATGKLHLNFPAFVCHADQPYVEGDLIVSAHVAGASVDPRSFRRKVQVACPYFGSGPEKVPNCAVSRDGGATPVVRLDASVGADAHVGPDAGALVPAPTSDAASATESGSSGCVYGGRTSAAPWAVLALAFALLRERRARRERM